MNINEYYANVAARFGQNKEIQIGNIPVTQFYEEKFEVKWLATKMKMFSFLSYKQEITGQDVKAFSSACFEVALNEYKGLPRGLQNGVVSFSVLAAERVDKTAADFVLGKPPKHYAAFEFPMIYDLTYNVLVYNHKKPMWGGLYYGYFMEYAEKNFCPA